MKWKNELLKWENSKSEEKSNILNSITCSDFKSPFVFVGLVLGVSEKNCPEHDNYHHADWYVIIALLKLVVVNHW